MQYQNSFTATVAADASVAARVEFIRKTYLHLGGAIAAFVALEAFILSTPLAAQITYTVLGTQFGWLMVLGAFMLVGYVAQRWAASEASVGMQYAGLALYVVAEALIFVPILFLAASAFGSQIITEAALYTGLIFLGLTATVFITKKDFSFMRGALTIVGFGAMGLIIASILFGFTLGSLFTVAMLLFAAGYILYYTSNVLHHYPVGSHVAASLALFAAVALLFWYVLRLLMSLRR